MIHVYAMATMGLWSEASWASMSTLAARPSHRPRSNCGAGQIRSTGYGGASNASRASVEGNASGASFAGVAILAEEPSHWGNGRWA